MTLKLDAEQTTCKRKLLYNLELNLYRWLLPHWQQHKPDKNTVQFERCHSTLLLLSLQRLLRDDRLVLTCCCDLICCCDLPFLLWTVLPTLSTFDTKNCLKYHFHRCRTNHQTGHCVINNDIWKIATLLCCHSNLDWFSLFGHTDDDWEHRWKGKRRKHTQEYTGNDAQVSTAVELCNSD